MPSPLSQGGLQDPPAALWWGNALAGHPVKLCIAVFHPQEGHKWVVIRLSTLALGDDAPSLASASVPDVQRMWSPPLLGSGMVLQGSISTAMAKHSSPYLAAFQATGDSWHRLQIKVQLLPSSKSCLLPCTAPPAWPWLPHWAVTVEVRRVRRVLCLPCFPLAELPASASSPILESFHDSCLHRFPWEEGTRPWGLCV